ncbi:NADPH-dependent FMN reductase [Dyella humicola]|uniref:NADPH-dependent FMN reductase n=1 Tax=Dyella humicola TaxID=2992126 RepID=UPI002252BA33|nr:NAD(P)H-dependent oxidoreductase [Dyella humicola]
MQPKILAISGSSRRGSLNQKLLNEATKGASLARASVSSVCLFNLQLPIYDGDWEVTHGLPEGARSLRRLIAESDALLIATPEHNGGYTAMLKNAIDWASRPDATATSDIDVFKGKLAAVISASPGLFGGARSQLALHVILQKLGVLVIPETFALGSAHQAFDTEGALTDPGVQKQVRAVGEALARTTKALIRGRLADASAAIAA